MGAPTVGAACVAQMETDPVEGHEYRPGRCGCDWLTE